jgi:signal transduction histidine kinase
LEATRAELAAAERQAGTLGERQRLAHEIHDTLAQDVTSVVTLLEATEAELAPGQAAARRHLDHALRTARDTLAEARRFVWALQPQALDPGSLAEALERLAETLADETGMTARFLVIGAPQPLSAQAEIALLRAAQEGTANTRKHARAGEAVLTLSYMDDRVTLDVRDDGRGFDVAATTDGDRRDVTGGLGLRGLTVRLAMLGGGLEVESAPGEGTVLVAQVPIGAAGPDTVCGAKT